MNALAGFLYFIGVLFLIGAIIGLISGSLVGFSLCAIFVITFFYIAFNHNLKAQIKGK